MKDFRNISTSKFDNNDLQLSSKLLIHNLKLNKFPLRLMDHNQILNRKLLRIYYRNEKEYLTDIVQCKINDGKAILQQYIRPSSFL